MTTPDTGHGQPRPHRRRCAALIAFGVVMIFGAALYAAKAPTNPPGFYIDESSIAYNAHLIAQYGKDEHGLSWPLYFRCFGDYKNPVYIYLLAALYRVTGPSIAVARLFSAALGVSAAMLLGLLGARVSKRMEVGVLVALTALLTPWLFELSRVVVEVAIYPLALALFLLALHRAAERERWSLWDALGLALTLALLTYTYSIGRLFAPLLACGLILFASRARLGGLLLTWLLYALTLAPLYIFQRRHPGSLTGRFQLITYITPQDTPGDIVWEFVKHFFGNLSPWPMLVTGDPNSHQIASIYGVGHVLAATFALALLGLCLVLRRHWRDPWWRFILYGLAVAVVPASLTKDYFHMLRLAALPVFLVVLATPALSWLAAEGGSRARRVALIALVALTLAQGAVFQWQYHTSARAPRRLHLFDADYPKKILATALNAGARPIYLADAPPIPGYIQAYWQATLRGLPFDTFARQPVDALAPEGAVVITTENSCPRCRVLAESEPYTVYVATGPPRKLAPLPADGFRAELRVPDPPTRLRAKEQATVGVWVKNTSPYLWPARERGGEPFQLSLGNHWLSADGRPAFNDDGRGAFLRDLRPGEEMLMPLVINAPQRVGDYVLEIDMLQEGVSWFGLRGSKTLRLPVRIE
jgi:4-amino-4-deoxy-L-arabinose transferase-like glycosyltransferase